MLRIVLVGRGWPPNRQPEPHPREHRRTSMPRTAHTLTAAPHYVTASTGGRHQVTDP